MSSRAAREAAEIQDDQNLPLSEEVGLGFPESSMKARLSALHFCLGGIRESKRQIRILSFGFDWL